MVYPTHKSILCTKTGLEISSFAKRNLNFNLYDVKYFTFRIENEMVSVGVSDVKRDNRSGSIIP